MDKQRKTISDRIDDVIAFVSPQRAMQRLQYRYMREEVKNLMAYQGAERNRFNRNDFPMRPDSADSALLTDLPQLRTRSRHLLRNNPLAKGTVRTMATNTVGYGMRPKCMPDFNRIGFTKSRAKDLGNEIEGGYRRWSKSATFADDLSMTRLWWQLKMSQLTAGEYFALRRMVDKFDTPYRFCWQPIEPDRISTPPGFETDDSVRAGIKYDESGRVAGYYVANKHPGDPKGMAVTRDDFAYVPARDKDGRVNMIHGFEKTRAEQSRGEPPLAPLIALFNDLGGYMNAEWIAARIASCFAVFIKQNNPMALEPNMTTMNKADGTSEIEENLRPGMIKRLKPNEGIESFSPNRPNGAFDPFIERSMQFIGAAMGFPYHMIIKDYSNANFSSARAGVIEARKMFRFDQNCDAEILFDPSMLFLVEEMWMLGELPKVRNFYRFWREYAQCTWLFPGWEWLDPKADAVASQTEIKSNLSSRSRIMAEQGIDFDEEVETIAEEHARMIELELNPDVDAKPGSDTQEEEGDDAKPKPKSKQSND